MTPSSPDFFDTDGRPEPSTNAEAERKLRVWAVLNAVDQGLLSVEEAYAAYGVSAAEMDEHRAGWLEFGAGSR